MSVVLRGNLRKMRTELGEPVKYQLPIGDQLQDMNALIGQTVKLNYLGEINCVACGRKTNKSFSQGYCFPCMRSLPECDSCIVKPETCHFAAGTCRDEEWGKTNCFQDHYVYLANSSGIKVGITRGSQIPTRWMDQGATQALPIMRVKNRLHSGLVEVAIKAHVADKTDWRKMLKGVAEPLDMKVRRDELLALSSPELEKLKNDLGSDAIELLDEDVVEIHYPVEHYPEKIKSLNMDKTPEIGGVLEGIKGQYLIFDSGVINIRKYGGYLVELVA